MGVIADDYSGQIPCEECGRKGYFKHGICAKCKPSCKYCGGRVDGPKGTNFHPSCSKKARLETSYTDINPSDVRYERVLKRNAKAAI